MIRLELNGVTLPLKEKEITLNFNNPMFNLEVVPGINTFPFNIIRTGASAEALNHPELIGNAASFERMLEGARIYFQDTLLFIGGIRVLNSYEREYRVVFYAGTANLKSFVENKLNTVDLGGTRAIPGFLSALATANAAQDSSAVDFQFPPFRNPLLYDGAAAFLSAGQPLNCEYFNYYDSAAGYLDGIQPVPVGAAAAEPNFLCSYVPWPYMCYVFKQIFKEQGIRLGGTFLKDEWVRKLLIYNTTPLEDGKYSNLPTDEYPFPASDLNLQNHVPNMEIGEFLKYQRRLFNLCFDFSLNSREIRISPFRDLFNAKPNKDWTNKILRGGSIEYSMDEGKYEFTIGRDSGDQEPVAGAELLKTWVNKGGANDTEVGKYIRMALEGDDLTPAGTRLNWLIPKTLQPGNSSAYNTSNAFDLRMLFYIGMQNDGSGNPFPCLNSENFTPGAVEIPGGFLLSTAEAIYERYYRDYVAMIKGARMPTHRVKWELEDLLTFSYHDKIIAYDHHYFQKKITLKLGNTISPADVDLIKVTRPS